MQHLDDWYSNFLPFDIPLEYQGMTFATPEHYFQAMKVSKDNIAERQEIANASSPLLAVSTEIPTPVIISVSNT